MRIGDFAKSGAGPVRFCSFTTAPFRGSSVFFVFFESARWPGSSFDFSLLMHQATSLWSDAASASSADAFDLFIDLGILGVLLPNGVVALHTRSCSYGAIDATSRCAAGRVACRPNC
jgi:hypothetical protein